MATGAAELQQVEVSGATLCSCTLRWPYLQGHYRMRLRCDGLNWVPVTVCWNCGGYVCKWDV